MPLLPRDRRAEAVAITLAAFAFVLLALPDQRRESVARSINHVVLLPVSSVRGAFGGYLRLRSQNTALRSELEKARIELAESDVIRRQNAELSQLFELPAHVAVELMPTRVISRDHGAVPTKLFVDVGRVRGARENLPVVTDGGLVGKVVSVGPRTSEIMLFTHPDFSASALLLGAENLEYGIVRPQRSGALQLLLPLRARSAPGDRIVTSGYGGTFPRGIPIGHVLGSQEDQRLGLQQIDRVQPAVDLGAVTTVFLVMQATEESRSAGDDLRLFWPGYVHPPMEGERIGAPTIDGEDGAE